MNTPYPGSNYSPGFTFSLPSFSLLPGFPATPSPSPLPSSSSSSSFLHGSNIALQPICSSITPTRSQPITPNPIKPTFSTHPQNLKTLTPRPETKSSNSSSSYNSNGIAKPKGGMHEGMGVMFFGNSESASYRNSPRTKITRGQKCALHRYFKQHPFITQEQRESLAKELKLSEHYIQRWFQNKRQRGKFPPKRVPKEWLSDQEGEEEDYEDEEEEEAEAEEQGQSRRQQKQQAKVKKEGKLQKRRSSEDEEFTEDGSEDCEDMTNSSSEATQPKSEEPRTENGQTQRTRVGLDSNAANSDDPKEVPLKLLKNSPASLTLASSSSSPSFFLPPLQSVAPSGPPSGPPSNPSSQQSLPSFRQVLMQLQAGSSPTLPSTPSFMPAQPLARVQLTPFRSASWKWTQKTFPLQPRPVKPSSYLQQHPSKDSSSPNSSPPPLISRDDKTYQGSMEKLPLVGSKFPSMPKPDLILPVQPKLEDESNLSARRGSQESSSLDLLWAAVEQKNPH